MNDQHNKMSFTDYRMAVNLVAGLSHLFSVAVNVFMHCGLGERYVGIPGLLIIPLTVGYAALTARSGGAALLAFVPLYMLMCLIWKAYAVYRRKRLRLPIHTRYSGKPLLSFLLPKCEEITVKRIEPFLVMLLGGLISFVNAPLGVYLVIAGIGQGLALAISSMIQLAKELDQMDAILEQEQLAGSTRELLGR